MDNFKRISTFLVILSFCNIVYTSIPQENDKPCKFYETINITNGRKLENGSILHNKIEYNKEYYAEYDYVLVDLKVKVPEPTHTRGCLCLLNNCVRFCCPLGQALVKGSCKDHHENEVFVDLEGFETQIRIRDNYELIFGYPCEKPLQLKPHEKEVHDWKFLQNGSIYYNITSTIHNTENYCLTNIIGEGPDDTSHLFICVEDEPIDLKLWLYPRAMLISVPFLLITFLVYALVPELQSINGKCSMCYVAGLIVLFICLLIVQLFNDVISDNICTVVGYLIYSSVLVCFFWLNVMCFDIWSVFRKAFGRRNCGNKKFINYSLYAFGVPFLFTSIVAFVDNTNFVLEEFKPRIGVGQCMISKSFIVEFMYLYLIISIVLCINIALYSITAFKLYTNQKEAADIAGKDSKKHCENDDRDWFYLYLRLFLIMGVTWVMEAVSWFFEDNLFFYITDVLNCLQGPIIFILFVCQRKKLALVLKRFGRVKSVIVYKISNTQPTSTTNL